MLIIATLAVPARAAQTVSATGIDADLDGTLSSITVSIAPYAQVRLGGEAFEYLERGFGASVAVSFQLAEKYDVEARFAATRNGEAFEDSDDRTTTLDVSIGVRWVKRLGGFELEAGPAFGYARLSRPLFVLPIHGFVVGAGVGVSREVAGGFRILFGADASWASFGDPPIAVPAPVGFEKDAEAHRIAISLGLSHRWQRR